ncbi:class I adenylate-forming enzyme family protein [Niveispirillum sp. KHB5.9]|uniref:class I adenylate-forming enzyme family protein n=1 Tax=Niveispirillum sp. KHB5.9 TaxID=3400269 RepID=UPI003A899FDE
MMIIDIPTLPRLGDYLGHYAHHTPDSDAAVLDGRRLSYAGLHAGVTAAQRALLALGLRPGDRVAMLAPPCPAFWTLFLAVSGIGGIWTGLNPKYRAAEFAHVLADAAPALVITVPHWGGRDYRAELTELAADVPSVRRVLCLEGDNLHPDLLAMGDGLSPTLLAAAKELVTPDSPALIVYTSGSTGKPKGAVLLQRGLVECSLVQGEHFGGPGMRMLNNLPINHIGSVGDVSCATLVQGGAIIFMEGFDPAGIVRVLDAERVTVWGQIPTMFQLVLDDPAFASARLDHLHDIVWSGAAAPEGLVRRLALLGKRLVTCFGMTETTGNITFTKPDADIATLAGTIGWPDPHYQVRLADADGNPVPDGTAAEIQVRGGWVMQGYFNRPEATAESFTADGWMRTGDLAEIVPGLGWRIVGRLKEMFKSGGYNVYPREVEQVIEAHPAVELAAVVGVPDPLYREVGYAFIQPRAGHPPPDAAALAAHCRENLANYKVPKRFILSDTLPLLPIGKLDKQALRVQAAGLAAGGVGQVEAQAEP